MLDEMLVRHCAPTLAGIKTGNLFSCSCSSPKALRDEVRRLNRRLSSRNLRLLPLRIGKDRALLYLYRPEKLRADLSTETAACILKTCGYEDQEPSRCLRTLRDRLQKQEDFPHEIGLFLSYPPEDVCGFMANGGKCYKCIGCWKVYGDEEKAKKTFLQYRLCTDIYLRRLGWGNTLEQLAVAG